MNVCSAAGMDELGIFKAITSTSAAARMACLCRGFSAPSEWGLEQVGSI